MENNHNEYEKLRKIAPFIFQWTIILLTLLYSLLLSFVDLNLTDWSVYHRAAISFDSRQDPYIDPKFHYPLGFVFLFKIYYLLLNGDVYIHIVVLSVSYIIGLFIYFKSANSFLDYLIVLIVGLQMFYSDIMYANINAIIFVLLMLAWYFISKSQPIIAGILIGLAIVKINCILFIPFYIYKLKKDNYPIFPIKQFAVSIILGSMIYFIPYIYNPQLITSFIGSMPKFDFIRLISFNLFYGPIITYLGLKYIEKNTDEKYKNLIYLMYFILFIYLGYLSLTFPRNLTTLLS